MKIHQYIIIGIHCLLNVSCAGTSNPKSSEVPASFGIDSIQSGDLICRLGNGFFSRYFKNYSGGNNRFSHMGIVHQEDSCFYVIHAEASEFTGCGSVRKELLVDFLDNSLDFQFYQVTSDSIKSKIDSVAYSYYKKHTPFDLSFDCTSDSALYCTELVANCINIAEKDNNFIPTFSMNSDFEYYRIIDIIESPIVRKWWKFMGWSDGEMDANLFVAKYQLYLPEISELKSLVQAELDRLNNKTEK